MVKKFGDDNAGILVANLAFSAFLCVFPLLLLLVTVLNIVLAHDPGARNSSFTRPFTSSPSWAINWEARSMVCNGVR